MEPPMGYNEDDSSEDDTYDPRIESKINHVKKNLQDVRAEERQEDYVSG